jgi:hypothetical protein
MGWVLNATPRPLYHRERPVSHCIGGWVGPRADLDSCGKSRLHRDWSPDRPARSESLYRLSYPRYNSIRGILHQSVWNYLYLQGKKRTGLIFITFRHRLAWLWYFNELWNLVASYDLTVPGMNCCCLFLFIIENMTIKCEFLTFKAYVYSRCFHSCVYVGVCVCVFVFVRVCVCARLSNLFLFLLSVNDNISYTVFIDFY